MPQRRPALAPWPLAAFLPPRPVPAARAPGAAALTGLGVGPAGARRFRLYRPPSLRPGEALPLLVMLHGCDQDAAGFAASTRMDALAARERFFVLYPEQDRGAHLQGCWHWYDHRRAAREAATVMAIVDQVCRFYAVDRARIAVAGLSAGAGMAALLASRYPERFRAVAMHSGIAPGVAHSAATALHAMRGRRLPADAAHDGADWPPLLVIQGSVDRTVAPANGAAAARLWAQRGLARPDPSRSVRRGRRHPMKVTDYRQGRRLVATLCEVDGLAHAWSGGAPGRRYSDAGGPDAARLIWAFAKRRFGEAA